MGMGDWYLNAFPLSDKCSGDTTNVQAMANNIWFPFYMGDYLAKTSHLSQAEHGAYLCLLLYYYSNKRPISHNRRYSICRAFAEHEQAACDSVLAEYFTRDGDLWRSARADEELLKAQDISEKRAKAAKSRYKQEQSNCNANAEQMHPHSQSQLHLQNTDINPLTPQGEPTKAKRNDAGTSITTQFGDNPICPDEWANFASREFGWSQGRIESTFIRFVDYWRGCPGAKGRKSDWLATWRNWCRSNAERAPGSSGQAGGRVPDKTAAALGGLLAGRNAVRAEGGAFGRNEGVLPDLEV